MKKIMIPVIAVIAVLLIVATILAKTNENSGATYHTHENGETHYDNQPEPTYHVHDDGVTHWDEH